MIATFAKAVRSGALFGAVPAWPIVGALLYVVLLWRGNALLNDADTFWQIAIGQWILDNHAVPTRDVYSLTMRGAPWVSSSWLSQVLYALAFKWAGWIGCVVLAAVAAASTFAILSRFLAQRLLIAVALILTLAAFILPWDHFLARPHLLAMPVMVAWTAALFSAVEREKIPPLWTLLLLALWANLHGSFPLGIVLAGAVALEAIWTAVPGQRVSIAAKWLLFGIGCLVACCLTPYGWGSLLAAQKILGLGEVLSLLGEWKPLNVQTEGGFELYLLAAIGLLLFRGPALSPPRIFLLLVLLHMALSHIRNLEVFLLLAPLVVAKPLATLLGRPLPYAGKEGSLVVFASAIVAAVVTAAFILKADPRPPARIMPVAAVALLKERGLTRVLNDYNFGGYFIASGISPFIDGRAELYGEDFIMPYYRALRLDRPVELIGLLDSYRIEATMLRPGTPAIALLDHLPGWQRAYADNVAIIHVRNTAGSETPAQIR